MGIIDDAKNIADLIKKYNDADLYQKILDLRGEIFELKEENLKLKEKIKLMTDEKKIESEIIYEKPCYWRQGQDGKKDGPFCQKCYDENKNLVRLQDHKFGGWRCVSCGNNFGAQHKP